MIARRQARSRTGGNTRAFVKLLTLTIVRGTVLKDLRYALRLWRQNPGSTFAAFLAIALGIGATTAIFSVVNTVILRPLPVKDEGSLVRLYQSDSRSDEDFVGMADFLDWKQRLKLFSGLALFRTEDQANLTGQGTPERVLVFHCDAALLPLLGVSPIKGRNFSVEETQPGHGDAAMLSWGFWKSHFGGGEVIGRKIILDEKPYTIVGLLPKDFTVLGDHQVWVPVVFDPASIYNTRGHHWYWAAGRLRPGVSVQQANAELASVAAGLALEYPKENKGVGAKAVLLRDSISSRVRAPLLMLLGAGLCVLLIACGNVASLALARASRRQREINIRVAVGASRGRLFRQLLTENVLLSTVAAFAGIGLAAAAVRLLRTLPSTRIPHPEQLALDWRVLLFAVSIGVATGIGFGLAPAIRASMIRVHDTMKQTSLRATDSKAQQRLRDFLVFLETAIATLLLIQSGLLIKSYTKAAHIDPGFDVANVLTVYISLPPARYGYQHTDAVTQFADRLLPRLRAIPGVEDAALTSELPLKGGIRGASILIKGQPAPQNVADSPVAQWTVVSPHYFHAMKMPLIAGRDFDERDTGYSQHVVLVNQVFDRQFLHGGDAIGQQVSTPSEPSKWRTIVGVAGDVPQLGVEKKVLPEIFYPLPQAEVPWLAIVLRTAGDPLRYLNAVRAQLKEVDPGVAAFLARSMEQIVAIQLGWRVFQTSLATVFAAVALVLACIGIYAVVSYSVSQRGPEIGIRMALGASKRTILRTILIAGALPALLGSVAGALCSLGISKLMSQLLYGIQSTDAATYVLVIALFLLVALAATYIPARRAAELDPSRALRYE